MKTLRRITLILLIAVFLIVVGSLFWLSNSRSAFPEAIQALDGSSDVHVTLEDWISFNPKTMEPNTGLIFYPGGRVDYKSYAKILSEIASGGYMIVLPEMPLDLAVLNQNAADKIIAAHPEIDHWVLAGHSLGGSMAALYAYNNQSIVDGVLIWASYPPDSADLSLTDLEVLVIYGELDEGSNWETLKTKLDLLPDDVQLVEILGGNHHQFGDYQDDSNDPPPTISRAEQQSLIREAVWDFLEGIPD
jgi:predicted esterase